MTDQVAAAPAQAPAPASAPAQDTPITQADLQIGEPAAGPEAAPAPAPAAAETVSYSPTGDVGLDLALDFVGKLGFSPEDPAMAAAEKGDFAMLKAKLAALGDKATGWERFVALAEKSYSDGKTKNDAKVAEDAKRIHDAVGGSEQWKAISKWAGENAEPEEKAAINAALKVGGLAAKLIAEGLASRYAQATGTRVDPAEVTQPNTQAKAGTGSGPITAEQYRQGLADLTSKVGVSNVERHPDYASLNSRRALGMRTGI